MKTLICWLALMSELPLHASPREAALPISVKHEYENNISLELVCDDLGKIKKLSVMIDERILLVPRKLLQELAHPEISTARVFITKGKNDTAERIEVTIDYNYRSYQWGWDKSSVSFYFSKEKFQEGLHSIPVEKGRHQLFDGLSK